MREVCALFIVPCLPQQERKAARSFLGHGVGFHVLVNRKKRGVSTLSLPCFSLSLLVSLVTGSLVAGCLRRFLADSQCTQHNVNVNVNVQFALLSSSVSPSLSHSFINLGIHMEVTVLFLQLLYKKKGKELYCFTIQ